MRIPKSVAQLMMVDPEGMSFLDSTWSCAVDAVSCALLIWAAVKLWVPTTSQSLVDMEIWNLFIAYSVMTVFGAEVPLGNALISGSADAGHFLRDRLEGPISCY